jgi:hypothetical protein
MRTTTIRRRVGAAFEIVGMSAIPFTLIGYTFWCVQAYRPVPILAYLLFLAYGVSALPAFWSIGSDVMANVVRLRRER